MEVNSLASNIRENTRNTVRYRRRLQRDALLSCSRNIDDISFQQNVMHVIEKLKTKSSVNVMELNLLKDALFENVVYTELFLGVHGALRGLIREFTGTDTKNQYEAALCLCNLALGNNKACYTVAKMAGVYLVASLDSMNAELVEASIWTIGNLAGSDFRTCEVLSAQGALAKLADKLANTYVDIIREGVLYALEHFLYNMKNDLSDDALRKIFQSLKWTSEDIECSTLVFFMSCHPEFPNIALSDDSFIENLLDVYLDELEIQCDDVSQMENQNFVYITRTLANVCISPIGCDKVLDSLMKDKVSQNVFSLCYAEMDRVRDAHLWLLGNLFNFASDNDSKRNFFSAFLSAQER